jgi:hypothetical protein
MLSMANEVLATTGDAGSRTAFAAGMDGKEVAVWDGLGHDDAKHVKRHHDHFRRCEAIKRASEEAL